MVPFLTDSSLRDQGFFLARIKMRLPAVVVFSVLRIVAGMGVRSVYSPTVNPGPLSLAGNITEATLDFAWTPAARPFPGPFSALWTATLAPPTAQPVWFAASFGSTSSASWQAPGSFFRLWVDDHFIINAQHNSANKTVVSYYPLVLKPSGSFVRAEFAVLGDSPTAALWWALNATGPWAVLPSNSLAPAASAAEDVYQTRRSTEEVGWNTWDADDMLTSVLLPSGIAYSLSFYDKTAKQTTANVQSKACSRLILSLHTHFPPTQ